MLFSVFMLALRSVRRNMLRSFLTILGIVLIARAYDPNQIRLNAIGLADVVLQPFNKFRHLSAGRVPINS